MEIVGSHAFRAFFSLIFHGRIADDILDAFRPSAAPQPVRVAAPPSAPVETTDRAAQMLALLQRDGRLVDFLMEDLGTYSMSRWGLRSATCIAAAVRPSTDTPRSRRSSTRPRAARSPSMPAPIRRA